MKNKSQKTFIECFFKSLILLLSFSLPFVFSTFFFRILAFFWHFCDVFVFFFALIIPWFQSIKSIDSRTFTFQWNQRFALTDRIVDASNCNYSDWFCIFIWYEFQHFVRFPMVTFQIGNFTCCHWILIWLICRNQTWFTIGMCLFFFISLCASRFMFIYVKHWCSCGSTAFTDTATDAPIK